jgi:DNA mismatch repair protein MSH6
MRIVEDDDSEEQENSLPSVADTTMADATPVQSMDLSVFRSNDTTPISKIETPKTFGSSVKKSTTKAEKFKEINQKRYSWLLDIKDADGRRETDPDYDPQTLFIPNTAWKEFTPFEKQFWEIKSQHWDKVVFFKKGKFYELYEKDATIGHQKFDLKLTDRVNMRMVGVPEMSFDYWAAQFIAKGYKVAKVEQLENSIGKAIKDKQSTKKKDDIIKRELKSILTSGTLVDSGLLSNEMSTYCMAVKQEGDKFGVAFVDTATAEFHLSHFQDDKECSLLETILMQLKPKELVLEKSNLSRNALRILKNSTPTNAQFNYLLPVKQFWDAQGTLEELKFTNYFKEAGDDSDDLQKWPIPLKKVMENKIVMSAFGGLVSYLRGLKIDRELISANNFNEYDPTKKADSLVLDGQTLLNLEIFENTFDGTDKGTLFNLINHCETPFGKRQFKRWVCHPLRSAVAIIDRQDAVEDLNGIKGVVDNLQSMFKKLPDLERLISRIHAGACKVKEFVSVLRAMESILTLSNDFEPHSQGFKSKSLVKLVTGFSQNLLPALDYFKSAFNNNEALDSDTIKPYPGFDSEYDLTEERVKELEKEFEEYRKKCEKEIQ